MWLWVFFTASWSFSKDVQDKIRKNWFEGGDFNPIQKGSSFFFLGEVRIAGHVFRKYHLHLLKHSTCQENPSPKWKKSSSRQLFHADIIYIILQFFSPESILNPPFLACGTSSSAGATGSGSGAADSSGATGSSSATGSGSGATSTRSPATSRVKGSLKKSPQSNGNRQSYPPTTHPQKNEGITLW